MTESKADRLIIDLCVASSGHDPAKLREAALATLLQARTPASPKILIRVNPLDTVECQDDLASLMRRAPYGIVLPRCQNGAAVQHLAAMLAVFEAQNNLADGATKIFGCAASGASAIFGLPTFQHAGRRLEALSWDPESLALSLGINELYHQNGGYAPPLALARLQLLFAAKAAHVLAIDAASSTRGNSEAFLQECKAAKREGFDGKIAIDIAQVGMINAVFGS
jgi:citrate lyase subunit beta/citryl-CoA lyase